MNGMRAENSMEFRAYIKARSLLGLKPVDIHHEVCDIYGVGQMSRRSVCKRVGKLTAVRKDLKDAALLGRPPPSTTKSNIKKVTNLLNQDGRYFVKKKKKKLVTGDETGVIGLF